ncbi:acyl dehydratase [Sphingomonas vulcanisoli]|uniref:Acyl dehydratase n=1 Tax=Sphingomonas vulcanisoli TaxID=1658060 RepID=A0ABX0TWP0_9SPHN|nr:MaoC family dehydratase [Sphingomonas vulcanisoli]NIJ08832.1 acyl dehydratase [Sphingomonas vulcanisoli]
MALYFEDLLVGYTDSFGSITVDRDEVIAFATAYDPQAFHLSDEGGAANPIFGRLAASGWHTAAMTMRMAIDHWSTIGVQSRGAAGLEELSWPKPTYPGDTLRAEAEVLEARPLTSLPDLGVLKVRTIVFNQHDQPVMRQIANLLIQRRPA